MTRIDLPYLSQETDRHGNERFYVRRHGKRIRVEGVPGSKLFLDAYRDGLAALEARAKNAAPTPVKPPQALPGTMAWLLLEYYRCAEFTRLDDSTQHARKLILDKVREKDGHRLYRQLKHRHLRNRRDAMAERPEAANSFIKALRQVFKWALEMEYVEHNPAGEVPYLESNNPEGFHSWTVEEVEQFEQEYPVGTKPRLALALLLYTGSRRSDVIKLGRQMVKDGVLTFREWKGRKKLLKERHLPILPELQRVLDATPNNHLTFLVTEHGKAYSHGGFGNWFGRQCRLAGLTNCSAHGLRKAGATIAANNGATEYQLMAIYGWQSAKQAAVYTRAANRKKLASEGMKFLSREAPTENGIVAPDAQLKKSATIGAKK